MRVELFSVQHDGRAASLSHAASLQVRLLMPLRSCTPAVPDLMQNATLLDLASDSLNRRTTLRSLAMSNVHPWECLLAVNSAQFAF